MNKVSAQYNAPPPIMGSITVTMPEELAQKLLAMLGRCNGWHFDDLHTALSLALPNKNRLDLLRPNPIDGHRSVVIDLHESMKFLPA